MNVDYATRTVVEQATKLVRILTEEEWFDLLTIGRQSGVLGLNQEVEIQSTLVNLSMDINAYEALKE